MGSLDDRSTGERRQESREAIGIGKLLKKLGKGGSGMDIQMSCMLEKNQSF